MPRSKAFDPDDALERAMELFWRHGYEGASMKALLSHMGISRQSLYDTFGDKQQLFEQALDRYARNNVSVMLGALERPGAELADLRRFFEMLPVWLATPERRACLMVNTMIDRAGDPLSVRATAAHRERLERAFVGPLYRAARSRRSTTLPPQALAEALAAMVLGIAVASRAGASAESLERMAASAIAMAGL